MAWRRSKVGGISDWGTANRIVPLGSSYLELVAVVDPGVAAASSFGRWVGDGATDAGRLVGWAVRTSELDDMAGRLASRFAADRG